VKPLATSIISDLYSDFPVDRLPDNNFVLRLFLRPESMVAMLVFYNVSKPIFKALPKVITPNHSSLLIVFIAVYNFALTVFSGVVAYNSWPIVVQHYRTYGLFETYCAPHGALWQESGFGAWAFIFYISKYYEFIDTWILVLKGKEPSFLQIYHHTGIAFCMWVGVLAQSSWLKYVVLFNSVIHTLMYTYFFVNTIHPQYQIKAARRLTSAQIGQFFIGIMLSLRILYMGDECDTAASRFGLACMQVYCYGLVALFMAFAKRKYKQK
jgi:hypothetical protein